MFQFQCYLNIPPNISTISQNQCISLLLRANGVNKRNINDLYDEVSLLNLKNCSLPHAWIRWATTSHSFFLYHVTKLYQFNRKHTLTAGWVSCWWISWSKSKSLFKSFGQIFLLPQGGKQVFKTRKIKQQFAFWVLHPWFLSLTIYYHGNIENWPEWIKARHKRKNNKLSMIR